MAAHPNRSPSPLSHRSVYLNPKISENNSAVRRSFGAKPSVLTNSRRFDPITPANSPSDFARRHSVDSSYPKEKENCEKDHHTLRSSKFQSLAKGSKSFMAPTISAASKFSPSPKKKVLVERNEPVRTSISLSDGKAIFFSSTNVSEGSEPKPEMGYQQNRKAEGLMEFDDVDLEKKQTPLQEDSAVLSKPLKRVTFSNVASDSQQITESVITDFHSLKVEENDKTSISIAPLDSDPFLPPYDPKTNYLSPRPQFLHYKPNLRIGHLLLNKEKGLDSDQFKQLEDSIMTEVLSESFSDSEVTEDSQNEELGIGASVDMVVGVEEETEECPHVSEPMLIRTTVSGATSEENLVAKKESKPWSLSRWACFSMTLMFLIAGASIFFYARPPIFDEIALKDLSLHNVGNVYYESRFAASAKLNFDRLARHVNRFSVDSLSFIPNLVNDLIKGENLGPLQFMNLSGLQDYAWNGGEFLDSEVGTEDLYAKKGSNSDSSEKFGNELNSQEVGLEAKEEAEVGKDDDVELEEAEMGISEEEGGYPEVDYDEELEKEPDTADDVLESEDDCLNLVELEYENSENVVSGIGNVGIEITDDQSDVISQDQNNELQVASDTVETEKFHDGNDITGIASSDEKSPRGGGTSSLIEGALDALMTGSPPGGDRSVIMGVSAFLAAILAVAAALVYQYKRKPERAANAVQVHSLKLIKLQKTAAETKDTMYYQKSWEAETEVSSEPCPSEMSSFQNTAMLYSSSSRKDLRGGNEETQSLEGTKTKAGSVYRRESMNSSSASEYSNHNTVDTGSPSYGSFTTFERIPIKKAKGEEEIVTPVRRSSRIRNHQATSP